MTETVPIKDPYDDGDGRFSKAWIKWFRKLKLSFDTINLSNLTASRLLNTDSDGIFASVSSLTSWIAGTTNQVTVTDDGDGTATLSTPQDIDTDADVTFDSITLDDLTATRLAQTDANKLITSVSDLTNWIAGTSNRITVTDDLDGTVTLSAPQDIHTGASPEFVKVTLSGLTASLLVQSDGSKGTASVSDLTNWIAGTTNRITVADDGDGTVTLSAPQDIHTGASPTFAGLTLSGLTASKPVFSDGSKLLISQDIKASDITRTFLTPTTQTVTTGTLSSGTVTDVQAWQDGNEVHISEVTGVPGFDVRYTFTSVTNFNEIMVAFYYEGTSTHDCQVQIYDDTNAVWKEFFSQYGSALSHNTRFSPFPLSVSDFINSSDQVIMRFYHPQTGNASHDLYIDYVALIN